MLSKKDLEDMERKAEWEKPFKRHIRFVRKYGRRVNGIGAIFSVVVAIFLLYTWYATQDSSLLIWGLVMGAAAGIMFYRWATWKSDIDLGERSN